jgi:simple sugar transport system ATP-binding protein
MNSTEPLLRVENLCKRFPLVWANQNVSLEIRRGEVHCLLGENGAGKTTLSECLYGAYRPDSGALYLKGEAISLDSPRAAIRRGIGMVHQHFVLAAPMSVVENVIVGTPSGWLLDLRGAEQRLASLCQAYGIELDLQAPVSQLSVGEQQWVEILKALYVGVELLILDEPTAVLTPLEAERLFAILGKMKQDGLAVIFITHKLDEVMQVSDRVTVLRKGQLVATVDTARVTKAELAKMMVGREVLFRLEKEPARAGPVVLAVQGLEALGDRGAPALRGVALSIRQGEVLGLAGVSGNGQRELFEVLVGMRRASAGAVALDGADITNLPPQTIAQRGVASVPADRIAEGLIPEFRVDENLVLGQHRSPRFARGPFVDQARVAAFAQQAIADFDIATPSAAQTTRVLSGGNLQKVILARELALNPRCLIINQPTRGLDVGATEYVRRRLLEQRQRGAAILLISEDLDEILNIADRIAVMFKGRVVGILDAQAATLERMSLLMAGITEEPQ